MLTTAILVANGHWDNDDTGMYGNMNEKNISYLANEILDTPYEIWQAIRDEHIKDYVNHARPGP